MENASSALKVSFCTQPEQTPNAMLAYGDCALSVQSHPEFTPRFLTDLLDARQAVLPPEIAKGAYRRLDMPLTSEGFADRIEAFFKAARKPAS